MRFDLQTLTDYSDAALLEELRRVAAEFSGERLTQGEFNKLSRVHSSTLQKRFGGWMQALDLAGISHDIAPRYRKFSRADVVQGLKELAEGRGDASITSREFAEWFGVDRSTLARLGEWKALLDEAGLAPVALGRRYTDDDCHENVLALWMHYGRQPRFAELNQPPSVVGSKAYVRRWGGWRSALAAFVERANDQTATSEGEPIPRDPEAVGDYAAEIIEASPRSISLSLRYRVLVRDRFRCVACGASPAKDGSVELHIDHILAWSRGGRNTADNLRVLCSKCNLGKGAQLEPDCRDAA